MKKFPFYHQPDAMDCGPTCLRMVAKHYGRAISLPKLRTLSETTREGSSLKNIADTAEKIGFRTLGVKISYHKLMEEAPLPCIVHFRQNHFVVVYKIKASPNPSKGGAVHIADPGHGLLTYTKEEFIKNWIGNNADETTEDGIALLLEPTPRLKQSESDDISSPLGRPGGDGLSFLFQYLFQYKKFITQLVVGLLAGSLLQLIFPFLTQSVVDVGIQNQDINFIQIIPRSSAAG